MNGKIIGSDSLKLSDRKTNRRKPTCLRDIAAQVGRGEFDLEGGKTGGEFVNRPFALRCGPQKICLLMISMGLRIPQGSKGEQIQEKKSLWI